MSTIRKTPYIEKVLASMTGSNLKDLKTVLNSGGNNVNLSFETLTNSYKNKVTPVYFQFEDNGLKTAILIWTNSYCTLVCYHRFQTLMLIELDPVAHTYVRINEDCDINELRRVLDDTIETSGGGIDSGDAEKGQVPVADGDGGVEWKDIPETLILTGESGTLTDDELALAKQSNVRLQLGDNGQFYYKNSQNNYYIIFKATARVAGDDTIVEKVTIDLSDNTYAYSYDVVAAGESFTPTYDDELSDASTNAVQNKVVTEALDEKANVDGNYPTMTVGMADNLTPYDASAGDDQDEPFSFQATGTANGTQSDFATGNAALMKEKRGNSVVVNQPINYLGLETNTINDVTFTNNNDGTFSLSGTASATAGFILIEKSNVPILPVGHKILFLGQTGDSDCYIQGYSSSIGVFASENTHIFTMPDTETSNNYLRIRVSSGKNTTGIKIDVRIIDLTRWFGSNDAIPADLLAHPENWYRYYQGSLAYNAGQIVNANSRYIKCIGRQQWDEEWENGYWDSTGKHSNANYVCNKTLIKVIPNTTYYAKTPVRLDVMFYDKDSNFISHDDNVNNDTFVTPSNCIYIGFANLVSGALTTYNNDITISLYYEGESGYDQYYPYEVLTNNNTGTEELKSAGSVADSKTPDGTITRKVGVVDLGTLDWSQFDIPQGNLFRANISNIKEIANNYAVANIICSKYEATSAALRANKTCYVQVFVQGIDIIDNDYSSFSDFKAAMSGVILNYELAEPTTEQGTPFSENLVIDDFGSMEFAGTSGVPQGNLIFYPVDYKAFVDTLYDYTEGTPSDIALKSNLIGLVEQSDISSQITDSASLTYIIKNASKTGKLVNVTIRAKNETGSDIAANAYLMTVPLSINIGENKYVIGYGSLANADDCKVVLFNYTIYIDKALANNDTLTFSLTYTIA